MIQKSALKKALWISNILSLNGVFFIMHYQKFKSIFPVNNYFYLYLIFISLWIIFAQYYKKIDRIIENSISLSMRIIFWSSLLSLLSVVIILSMSDLWAVSRFFVLSYVLISFLCELCFTSFLKIYIKSKIVIDGDSLLQDKGKISNKFYIKWLLPGIFFLILTYVMLTYFSIGTFQYNILHEKNFLILISSWGLGTLLTNRYKEPNTINHYYEIAPYIKAAILTILFLTFFSFLLRISPNSMIVIYKASLIHSTIEIIAFFLFFFGKSKTSNGFEKSMKDHSNKIKDQQVLNNLKKNSIKPNSCYEKNELSKSIEMFDFNYSKKLIDFIWNNIKEENFSSKNVTILNTVSTINVDLLNSLSKDLFINTHPLNDFRRINEYLLSTYSKIKPGGIMVGSFIPLEHMKKNLRSKMPHFLYSIILPFYFIFRRVFPKIAITKQIYFILTNGRNRVLSKSEVLGRLSFCGYELVDECSYDDRIYFICKKKNTISNEKFPSYGPIVKLKRIGYLGKLIYVYKLRTMYPYSEFIQGDIYEKNHLDLSGKMKNDYRITSWGRIFRRYFIDEIPQVFNWIRGDLNLIGVRALSEHYFSLYPKSLQQKRTSFKPGLIPPYYADLPKTFDEIIESEINYLNKKERKPFTTDLIYFFKSIFNIFFIGARSK